MYDLILLLMAVASCAQVYNCLWVRS